MLGMPEMLRLHIVAFDAGLLADVLGLRWYCRPREGQTDNSQQQAREPWRDIARVAGRRSDPGGASRVVLSRLFPFTAVPRLRANLLV